MQAGQDRSLKEQAFTGMVWTAGERLLGQVLRFAAGVVLARLLLPADYGVVPLVSMLLAVCAVFVDSGMSAAVIRKPVRREADYATLFWFNLAVAGVCYAGLFLVAPWVADFFEVPVLRGVTRVLGLNLLFGALGSAQRTRLQAELRFRLLAGVEVAMALVSGVGGVWMALAGWGVWALVWPGVAASAAGAGLYWRLGGVGPGWRFSGAALRELFGFGSKVLCTGVINEVYGHLSGVLIGKFHSLADLGLYGRGAQMSALPGDLVSGVMQRVAYPLLARVNGEAPERLGEVFRRVLRVPVFVLAPALTGLCVVGAPLVEGLLGAKWAGCVGVLQIWCFGRLWGVLTHLNLSVLYVRGRSDLVLRLEVMKKSVAFAMVAAGACFGVVGLACAVALYEFVAYGFNCYYTGRFLGFGLRRQLGMCLPIFANCALLAAGAAGAMACVEGAWAKVAAGTAAGAGLYFGAAGLARDETLREGVAAARRLWGRLRCNLA